MQQVGPASDKDVPTTIPPTPGPSIKATTDLPDENALLIASGIQIRCRRSHSTLNCLFGSMIPREGGQPTRRGYAPSRRTCQTGGRHTHVNS